jgi:hypothetical protein
MAQLDESLAHYHVVLPDGRIKGRKVFCAPDFEEGEICVPSFVRVKHSPLFKKSNFR